MTSALMDLVVEDFEVFIFCNRPSRVLFFCIHHNILSGAPNFNSPCNFATRTRIVPAGARFGSVNRPEIFSAYQQMCGGDFGYAEHESEVKFDPAPRI